ncbi:MAG TPA: hypothetical protein VF274_09140 [Alphaproteobacteria bacterium]
MRTTATASVHVLGRQRGLAALGVVLGAALALAFGADLGAALAHGWDTVVLPAYHTLNMSGFATCL